MLFLVKFDYHRYKYLEKTEIIPDNYRIIEAESQKECEEKLRSAVEYGLEYSTLCEAHNLNFFPVIK